MKVVMIIAQKDFRDEEYLDTKAALEHNGIEVRVAAPEDREAVGKFGERVMPGLSIADIKTEYFSACILIGGPGAFGLIGDSRLNALIQKFCNEGKVVAAICIAPAILAEAGLLKGKRATIHESGINYLEKADAICVDNDLVVEGNIITANGPAVASRFGQEIANQLLK